MSDEEFFDDEEDDQDFDPGDLFGDDLDPYRFFVDDESIAIVQALHGQPHEEPSPVDQTAIERTVQIRVSKRLTDDPTLRRLLMKACQFGHKGVLDKLLDLGVRTTGDFSIEVGSQP